MSSSGDEIIHSRSLSKGCVSTEASVNSSTKGCETSPPCEPSGKTEDWRLVSIKIKMVKLIMSM